MAKKTADNHKKEMVSFSSLNDALTKISPEGAIIEDSIYAKIDEWIPTGSYILNAAMSGSLFGGMPNRRSLMFAGQEGTGKTYLALSVVRNAQIMDYFPIYYDSEGSIDIDFIKRLGIDTSKFRIENVSTVEEFATLTAKLNETVADIRKSGKTPPKIMVVLDSLGNLSSIKEKADTTSGDNKRDMTKQQAIRRTFRVIGNDFAKNGIPFIVCNHVYACTLGDTKLIMKDGTIKEIKDLNIGEEVLTMSGPKEILNKFEYIAPKLLELTFEDNCIIKCTSNHKFAIEKNNELVWIEAENLNENDEILLIE